MGVVSPKSPILFCEGKPDSLDFAVLKRLVTGHGFTIQTAGGKQGIAAFARGRLSTNDAPFIIFRDRDFDKKPTEEASLLSLGKNTYLSHRACIENYLIDSELMLKWWEQHHEENPKWQWGAPPEKSAIEDWIATSARSLTAYQAVRWALASMKTGDRWPEIQTTWTGGSGKLPASLEPDSCKNEGSQLVAEYIEQSKVNPDSFHIACDDYLERFQKESFWKEKEYLIWFHGKDLQKAMARKETLFKKPSLKEYFSWASEKVSLEGFSDLQELGAKIKDIANS